MSLKNSIIVLWVFVMYGLGMWIFFSGYLLKRIVIHEHSSEISNFASQIKCHNYSSLHRIGETFNSTLPNSLALKRFDKAIIIIIDALRYDFAVRQSSEDSYYSNKMPVFSEISPDHCLVAKLIADPPTTTLQRLTGLMTGSLPTFIDISMNFASLDIVEDNLIWQLNNSGKKIVFMGDDTWEGLFPNQFHRSFPFPSFNVKDLDTVDDGILDNIYEEIKKPDWDVIIAHFLGVDHCGHRYGPNHPAMARKLQQMDSMIRNVTKVMKKDTLLVVLGDHGMSQTGDHGGDSHDEISTVLFLYSPSTLISGNKVSLLNSSILQIDLVPTLSLLLGIPIPFSNLGSIVPQLFVMNSSSSEPCFDKMVDSLIGASTAAAENAFQVHRYLMEYIRVSGDFSLSTVNKATQLLRNVSELWKGVGSDNSSLAFFHQLKDGYENYLTFVQQECRAKWAKFNFYSMTVGSLLLFSSVTVNFILAQKLAIKVPITKLFMLVTTLCIAVIFHMQNFYIFITFCTVVICFLIIHSHSYCKQAVLLLFKLLTVPNIVLFLIAFNHFSNSFVVYEDRILLFMLQTLIVCNFLPSVFSAFHTSLTSVAEKSKKTKSSRKPNFSVWLFPASMLCLLSLMRLSYVFRKCREEQLLCETSPFLMSLENIASTSSTSYHITRLCLSWIAILVPVIALVVAYNYMQQEKSFSTASICLNYGIPFITICICFHWWLAVLPAEVLDRILGENQVVPARCALIASILLFVSSWIVPLLPENPLSCPTNRIYIGSMMLFVASVLLPLYLVAGDGLAPAVSLMVATLVLILAVNGSSQGSEPPSDILVLLWAISSNHWFYSTGHQPTFPSLHWNAAFIISKEVVSYIVSGSFVVMNTFSSQILHGITLPLLLLSSNPPKFPKTPLFYLVMKYLYIQGFRLLGSVLACFVLCRHLMVWKVFTPKLIYETLGFCVTSISVFVSYIFVLRVITCLHRQIKKSAGQLWFLKDD